MLQQELSRHQSGYQRTSSKRGRRLSKHDHGMSTRTRTAREDSISYAAAVRLQSGRLITLALMAAMILTACSNNKTLIDVIESQT